MADFVAVALPVIGGICVLLCAVAGLFMVGEWAINRIVRACGVYSLVVQFIWDRVAKRHAQKGASDDRS